MINQAEEDQGKEEVDGLKPIIRKTEKGRKTMKKRKE